MPAERSIKNRFMLLQLTYWTTIAAFNSYIVVFITQTRGATAAQSGTLLALFLLCGCAGQFVVNTLNDRFQMNRTLFIVITALSMAVYYAVYNAPTVASVTAWYCLIGFLMQALPASIDTWTMRSMGGRMSDYTDIRSIGSISYAFMMLLMGFLIENVGFICMPITVTITIIAGIVVAWGLPNPPPVAQAKSGKAGMSFRSIPSPLWIMVVSMFFLGMANTPLLTMFQPLFGDRGVTAVHLGLATFANTVAEFATMRFGGPILNRTSPRARLVALVLIYVVATACMFVVPGIALVILLFGINGIAYGMMLPTRRQLIAEMVPDGLQNRMQAMGDMSYVNFGGLIGSRLAGDGIDRFGGQVVLAICVALQCVSLAFAGLFIRAFHRKSPKT